MTIYIRKCGTSKRGPYCLFVADFENGYIIHGIANLDADVVVKEEQKYTNLYLEQHTFSGQLRYTLHKKEN